MVRLGVLESLAGDGESRACRRRVLPSLGACLDYCSNVSLKIEMYSFHIILLFNIVSAIAVP